MTVTPAGIPPLPSVLNAFKMPYDNSQTYRLQKNIDSNDPYYVVSYSDEISRLRKLIPMLSQSQLNFNDSLILNSNILKEVTLY